MTDLREAAQMALDAYESRMQQIGGCSDGGCVVVKPKGMHTNGGCKCWKNAINMQRLAHAANKLVNALRAALAQPEHKPLKAATGDDLKIYEAIAAGYKKQEPVAWRTFDGEGGYDYRSYEMNENYAEEWAQRNPNHKGWVEPLYTAPSQREIKPMIHTVHCECGAVYKVDEQPYKQTKPPKKKEWQGLTDEEICNCFASADTSKNYAYARAIEKALREKNT